MLAKLQSRLCSKCSLSQTGYIALQGRPDHGVYSAAQPFLNNLPCLTISLPGQERNMTVQEASQLSLQQFSALYTVCSWPAIPFVHELVTIDGVASKLLCDGVPYVLHFSNWRVQLGVCTRLMVFRCSSNLLLQQH